MATPDEIREYPPVTELLSVCQASKHLEVTDCEPVKQRTCSNMHIQSDQAPSVCTSGCVCKFGYVLDALNGACIKEEDCPCHHGGKSYTQASVIQAECNTCTCEGTKWKCTDRICAGDFFSYANSLLTFLIISLYVLFLNFCWHVYIVLFQTKENLIYCFASTSYFVVLK